MTKIFHNKSGFTLTEMAMVLMIMGIIASLGMAFLNTRMSQTSYTVTKQRMAAIKESMISYLRVNGRLPCPDTVITAPTGAAAALCSSPIIGGASNALDHVDTSFGIIPWQTLGLPRESALDGWGNFFTYHVSAVNGSYYYDWTIQRNFSDNDKGEFIVQQKDANGVGSGPDVPWVVLVIVSHGPSGKGAYTVKGTRNVLPVGSDELENTNGNNTTINNTLKVTYVKRDFSDNTGLAVGAFDDIFDYMTVADLVGPLIKEGSTKSDSYRQNITKQRLDVIKDKLISWLLTNNRFPCPDTDIPSPTNPYNGVEDPLGFGKVCNYSRGVVPYVTIGLSKEIILDGWDYYIVYHVSNQSVVVGDNWIDETTVHERTHGDLNVTDIGNIVSNVVVVLVSPGKNGNLDTGNDDGDVNYVNRLYDPTQYTNNFMTYITVSDLVTAKIRSGSKSANARLAEQFSSIRNILIGAMLTSPTLFPNNGTCQFSALATLGWTANDPWGMPFIENLPQITAGTAGTTPIFTITSYGPDKAVYGGTGPNDDVTITMTKFEGMALFSPGSSPNCLQ